ncbi:MAG: carbohydrate ABC transporter permease [Epulopiscium sp.]|nr:carbohydrate ABC transporter permease [Candidatus Epulonipiscium sp.]
MKNKRTSRIKYDKSERSLKIVAVVFSLIFAGLMLYPLIFTVSSAMKDNVKIYEVPPKLLPGRGNSVSLVLDYSDIPYNNEDELKDIILRDNVINMFGINESIKDDFIMEVKVFGVKDGETIFYSRAHQMKLQMEQSYGVYKSTSIKPEVLLHEDRYIRANNSIGYEFDINGISKKVKNNLGDEYFEQGASALQSKFPSTGSLLSMGNEKKSLLNLENFKYYLKMPQNIYPNNERISQLGFMTFVINSIIVIGFAVITQVFLCSICAFVISKQLSERAGKAVLLFFLIAMMVPFASIMLPQLIMYKKMGAYNNYAALLLPFLYPFGFYVYLYKGFFDQIPRSYFEAAELDGAGSIYLYSKICMPLSKPIISLIALQTFLGNWNDFFWAWMVTEDQRLWTLNVALYNISNNSGTRQNAIMGLAVVTITPVILLSILFSNQLKQSVISSGVKG